MIKCEDESLYTGISTDPQRRFKEHLEQNNKGAKYTRTHKPIEIVYIEEAADRSAASKREYEIKQLTRKQKLQLIAESNTIK